MHTVTRRGINNIRAFALACAICVVLIAVGAGIAPAAQLKAMTYNIHGTVGANVGYSSTNAQKIAKIVNYFQPDILTMNEVEGSNTTTATNNVKLWCNSYLTYLGGQPGVSYFYYVSPISDGYNRNAIISRYPISDTVSYSLPPRDLLCGTIAIPGTPGVRVFTAHFKASSDCTTRQSNADNTKLRISSWSGNPANATMPYMMCGDLNEDETNSTCTITSSYHPITTVREAHLNEYQPDSGYGNSKTWSSASSNPTTRFDYILPSWHLKARPRNSPSTTDNSTVVDTMAWYNHGQLPASFARFDSQGSDHLTVLATFDILSSSSAGTVRDMANGSEVFSELQTVTASFTDHFYIEDSDRLHGVRVNSNANPGVGNLVSIQGTWIASPTDEDFVAATGVRGFGQSASMPKPWAMGNQEINGEAYQGVRVPRAGGPPNAGLLVRTWGRVVSSPAPASGVFYIDDGSHWLVRVSSQSVVNVNDLVTVIGVVGFHVSGGAPERFLETRTAADVQVLG